MKLTLNIRQRTILAFAIPVVILIWVLAVASDTGRRGDPFDWSNTGGFWIVGIVLISIFEIFLLRDRSK